MNKTEKTADNLGQVIFRLEINFECLTRNAEMMHHNEVALATFEECCEDISKDFEKLKLLKEEILSLDFK